MNIIRTISWCSICCVVLAIICGIPYILMLEMNIYSDGLLATIIYLFRAGLILGLISVVVIIVFRKYWLGLIPAIISILICSVVVWIDIEIARHVQRRQETLKTKIGDYNLHLLGENLVKYANNHNGYLPDSNQWCDVLLANNANLIKSCFRHPDVNTMELKGECHFAFNKNLSGMKLADIPPDVVLVFEADGHWNMAGGAELFATRYCKDGYITILFVDQSTANYWYDKNAVKKFNKKGTQMYYAEPRWSP